MTPADGSPPELLGLEGEYEFLRELGRGGMAAVYLARHLASGQLVAIKAIRPWFMDDKDAVSRFAREARVMAKLDHPNIVRTYDVEQLGERAIAIVMQQVEGGTLRETLRAEGALPFGRVSAVLRDLAEALRYAHGQGVVHRDVKPENIFLEAGTGRALLSDFGIARSMDSESQLTIAGAAIGTPAYMSPEQIDGDAVDERSDVYSLGLVGWEMVAGRRPWEGESLYSLLHKQKHAELPRLPALRPGIPTPLLYAIEGALHKHRDTRWANMDEFLDQLFDEHDSGAAPEVRREERREAAEFAETPTLEFLKPDFDGDIAAETARLDAVAASAGDGTRGEPEDGSGTPSEAQARGDGQEPREWIPLAEAVAQSESGAESAPEASDDEAGLAAAASMPAHDTPSARRGDGDFAQDVETDDRADDLEPIEPQELAVRAAALDARAEAAEEPAPEAERFAPVFREVRREPDEYFDGPTLGTADETRRPRYDDERDVQPIAPVRGRASRWRRSRLLVPAIIAAATLFAIAGVEQARRSADDDARADSVVSTSLGGSIVTGPDSAADTATMPAGARAPAATKTTATRAATRTPRGTQPAASTAPVTRAPGRSRADSVRRCASPAAADQRACLTAMLADSDAGLNRVYSQLITALRRRDGASTAADPASVRQLRSEERTWIVRRDEACRQRGRGREGALWAPSRAKCLGEMSAQRARELQDRLRRVQGR